MGFQVATNDSPELESEDSGIAADKYIPPISTAERTGPQVAVTPAQLRVVRGLEYARFVDGAWPSVGRAARIIGASTDSVVRHLRGLRRVGVVALDSNAVVVRPTGIIMTPRIGAGKGRWS